MDLQASCFALYLFCMTNDLSMIENIFYDILLSMFFICEYCVFLVLYFARKFLKLGHSFSVQLSFNQHPKRNINCELNRQFLFVNCLNTVSHLLESYRKVVVSRNRKQVCLRGIQRRFIVVKILKSSVEVVQYVTINVCTSVLEFDGKVFGFKTHTCYVSMLSTRHAITPLTHRHAITPLTPSSNNHKLLAIEPTITSCVHANARLPALPGIKTVIPDYSNLLLLPKVIHVVTVCIQPLRSIVPVITNYNHSLPAITPVITDYNQPLRSIAPVISDYILLLPAITPVITDYNHFLPAIAPITTVYVPPDVPLVTLQPALELSNVSDNDSNNSKDKEIVDNSNQTNVLKKSRGIEPSSFKVCNALQRLRKQLPSVASVTTPSDVSADILKSRDQSIQSKSFKGCNVFKRFRQQEISTTKLHSTRQEEIKKSFTVEYDQLLSFLNQAPVSCDQASKLQTATSPYIESVDPYMEKIMGVVNQPQFGGTLSPEMLAYPILEHLDFKTYLGGGAFGRVYKTLDKANHEIITLKVVQNSVESDDEVTFMQELCGHQNIVEITWVHHTSQFAYIAMKNHGEQIMSLSKYIAKAPQINEDMLSVIGRQVASGLSFINSMGIAHLDLKEDNCIINEHLEIRIIDFGLSMRCRIPYIEEPHYRYGGTMHYMSPECINETGYYGPEVDSWSFGVMLYTMFTGSFPFTFNDNGELDLPFYRKYPKPNRAMSNDLRDLFDGIFERNIFERMTSQEFQSHNFLRKNISLHQDYLSPFF